MSGRIKSEVEIHQLRKQSYIVSFLKKISFTTILNAARAQSQMSLGSAFQSVGPATEKARSP